MPKALERKLKKEVAGKNWSQEHKDAYVYGTMRKTGWTPSTQKPSMESAHKSAMKRASK